MLRKLKITNFKSIISADLEFGKVNLFIGPNGGGKTNVLEAIGIVSAALGRSISPDDLNLRGVRLSLPRLFKATYKRRRIPRQFSMLAEFDRCQYSFSLTAGDRSTSLAFAQEKLSEGDAVLLGRSPRGHRIHLPQGKLTEKDFRVLIHPTRGIFDMLRTLVTISEGALGELDQLTKYAIYAPQTSILRGMVMDTRAVEPLGLTGGRLPTAFQEVLNAFSKDTEMRSRYLDIIWQSGWTNMVKASPSLKDVVPPQVPTVPKVVYFRDKFMRSDRSWLSAYDASEGTLYLLFVATLLAHRTSPRVFALDNVDGTLNPQLVRRLVEHIVKIVCSDDEDRQVFLTSHNPTALDALDIFDPDHRVYVVRRDIENGGRTVFDRVRPPSGMTREEWIEKAQGRNTSVMLLENLIPGALG
jgi:ABC-type branched-subunit amino acid transport system ATPase component